MSSHLRIVHVEPLPEWIQGIYHSAFEGTEYDIAWTPDAQKDESVADMNGAFAIVTGKNRVTERLISSAGPDLRLVQAIGRAPWAVDLECAKELGVQVSFLPHRGAIAVAEHTFALLLGIMRKLVPGHVGTVSADYQSLDIVPIRTSERTIAFNWLGFPDLRQLFGKTIGLVGLGDIGLEVARRARAFDMEVLYTKRSPMPAEYDAMVGVRYAPLPELLEQADVVSLHSPHTDTTEGIISSAALALMKNTAILINTARGGLVDERALVDALRTGKIAAAGLDCFVDEPLPTGHALLDLDNVLLSPHAGGGTGGGQKGVVADIKANIDRVARGDSPHHQVSP